MSTRKPRVRFAPAPTGMMHLGNIRTALMNAIFAKKHNGTFVLRIEDTDAQRNYDPQAKQIIADLEWLGLHYDEGPRAKEPHGPYFQSQRDAIYQKYLDILIKKGAVYRCFCSEEELEKKRDRQRALKLPPRYDRTCYHRSQQETQRLLDLNTPYLWRLYIDHTQIITVTDLAHKQVTFDMQHFSDFPLTRQDNSFTFMFANCVDDIDMRITHVFRGEDHLTNTGGQAALYRVFDATIPIFWHMPILCNTSGKKLSKRDFGFSLRDLKDEGFCAEALVNYLAIIGSSYKEEIMSFDQLVQTIEVDAPHTTGHITYDIEKLRWINRKWIERFTDKELVQKCLPFLQEAYPTISLNAQQIQQALQIIKTDMITLKDCVHLLAYYFKAPELTSVDIQSFIEQEHIPAIKMIIRDALTQADMQNFASILKQIALKRNINLKQVFRCVRLALTGSINGPGIQELVHMLGMEETQKRLEYLLNILS